jgi:hypothetical protein
VLPTLCRCGASPYTVEPVTRTSAIGPAVDTMSAPNRTTFGVRVPKYM